MKTRLPDSDLPSNSRTTAYKVLTKVLRGGAYSNLELDDALDDAPDSCSGFVTEVVYGCLRHLKTLDWVISKASGRALGKIDPKALCILRIALYQTFYMETVPFPIAVNESVLLARRFGNEGMVKFVNAILRNIGRASGSDENLSLPLLYKKYELPALADDPVAFISISESHPEWLVKRWIKRFGPNETKMLCAANNRRPYVNLRCNFMKTDRERLLDDLHASGYEAYASSLTPEGIACRSLPRIDRLKQYESGEFQVQDDGAILIGHILDPQPGETVLDVCSAPGGKATHCAELMKNTGQIIAVDLHPNRLKLVSESANRLGHTNIRCIAADAGRLEKGSLPVFDKILVDAPCSGTGVLRHKPEIRWRRHENALSELVTIQREILASVSRFLKVGGTLVYSTCSLEPEENEGNLGWFLNKFTDYKTDISDNPDGYLYTYPHIHDTDGFFISRLRRIR